MSRKEKTQSVSTIDELLQTKNKHYNKYAQKVVTECISKDIFPDVNTALNTYADCLKLIVCADKPVEAARAVMYRLYHMQTPEFTDRQRYFILQHVADYINPYHATFGKWKLQEKTYEMLKSHIARLEKGLGNNRLKTADIMETLKTLMQKEISELPQRLEKLDDEKRLGIICKLMPYVFPKVETVEASRGENKQWDED
jgi:hypothetical protein